MTDGSRSQCDWCGKGHYDPGQALKCCSEDFDRRVNSRPITDGGHEHSTSDTDHCPNCGSVGDVHYDGVANNLDVEEWDCYNENCRVSLYYVQPGGDRRAE